MAVLQSENQAIRKSVARRSRPKAGLFEYYIERIASNSNIWWRSIIVPAFRSI
jgi:hypothetical protein